MSVDIPSVPPFDPDRDYFAKIGIDRSKPHVHANHTDDFTGLMPRRYDPTNPANVPPMSEHEYLYGEVPPTVAPRASSQAGLASFRPMLDRIGPGAGEMVERELARAKAFEVIARAAIAFVDSPDALDNVTEKALTALVDAVLENRAAVQP